MHGVTRSRRARPAGGLTAVALAMVVTAATAAEPPSFRSSVAPLLVDRCIACHNAKKAEAGYRLDSYAQLTVPGDSGEAPIVAGASPGGEVLRRITAEDPAERMPPEAPPLPPAAVAAVRDWLAAGGRFDGEQASEPTATVMPPRMQAAPKRYPRPVPVTALTFSPDGDRLFVGGYHEVLVFDASTGGLVRRLDKVGQRVTALRWTADGRMLVVAGGEPGRDGDVRLVDVDTGQVTKVMARATDVILDVALRPNADDLAVAGADGVVRFIDIRSGAETRAISSHGDWVTAVAWSDDGRRLASASRDKTVKIFEADSGELVATFSGHGAAVRGVALSADGAQGYSAGDDQRFWRWNAADGKAGGGPVGLPGVGLRVVRMGDTALIPHAGRAVAVINLGTNKVASLPQPEWPLAVACDAERGRVATGAIDGEVRVFTLADGGFLKAWPARP